MTEKVILFLMFILNGLFLNAQSQYSNLDSIRNIAKNGEYNKAIHLYSTLINNDTLNYELYYERGSCYAIQEENKLALLDFNKSIQLNSKFSKAYYNRSIIRKRIGNYEASKMDMKIAKDLERESINSKSTLSTGNFCFKKVIEVGKLPKDSIVLLVNKELAKTFKDPKSLLKEHNSNNGVELSTYESFVNSTVSRIGFTVYYNLKVYIKENKVKFEVENFQAFKNGKDEFANKIPIGNLANLVSEAENITINKWNAIKQDVSNQINGMLEKWEVNLKSTDSDGF